MTLNKKAFQMSYDVSDQEKRLANTAIIAFNHSVKLLNDASDYLNKLKTPFKDNPDIDPEEIHNTRSHIRDFQEEAIENFNNFKESGFDCVNIMQTFSSDTQIIKLMKSFISSIDELEKNVNEFVELFNDLQSKDFTKNVVEKIESIQNKCEEISNIVNDRIKNHIQSNILAQTWIDSVSKNKNVEIKHKTPLVLDLYNEKQDELNENIKEKK